MKGVYFSLTESLVIHPALRLRAAPLNTIADPISLKGKMHHLLDAQVVARFLAATTSVFSAIDCVAHFGLGMEKGIHFGLGKVSNRFHVHTLTKEEITHHLKQSAKFFLITIFGSIVATASPSILKYFQIETFCHSTSRNLQSASERVKQLWEKRMNNNQFDEIWETSSLDDRRTFVQILNNDPSDQALETKKNLFDSIYRNYYEKDSGYFWPPQQGSDTFYHTTSYEGLKGILQSGKIEVKHEKAYRGAFVSDRPETVFGKYVLVFNRNIERLSNLEHGFPASYGDAFWAGFSRDIPVNGSTLRCVLYDDDGSIKEEDLKKSCYTWAKRDIEVNRYPHSNTSQHRIPIEWPDEDRAITIKIQNTMRIRAQQQKEKEESLEQQTLAKDQNEQTNLAAHRISVRSILHFLYTLLPLYKSEALQKEKRVLLCN